MGNHEFTGGPDYRTRIDNYRKHVGPEWYSFDYGRRHSVVLENHQGFSQAEQLEWLEGDLERHAKDREVVVIVHKPLTDPQHTGVAPDVLPPTLRLAWSHRTPGTILTSSPAVVDGVVYVGTRDEDGTEHCGVRAVDFATGRRLWRFKTEAQVQASPAVAGGLVFASTIRGTLHAIDAATGDERWSRAVGTDEVNRGWMYFSRDAEASAARPR